MTINWPTSLITEIARRRTILFLGAGVTATAVYNHSTCSRPKTWDEFLRSIMASMTAGSIKDEVQRLIDSKNFLLALQLMHQNTIPSEYDRILRENFNNTNYKPSKLHELIRDLDSKIVITTNFDKLYETFCESTGHSAYSVIQYHEDNLGDCIRSDQRLIIKAHGSINNPNTMIFTRKQYNDAKKMHPNFYEILKSLFLTNTCIFIGCGGDDPDISLVLQDVQIISSATYPHYILCKTGSFSLSKTQDLKETYNIHTLTYEPTHDNLIDDLGELLDLVRDFRIRHPEP